MAHYRKIDSRIQNDEKFCSLSDDGQLVFLLILTHPHLTALGAMRGSVAGLAAEKRWPEKRYRKAFQESAAMGMVKYDEKSSLIWLPNFLKYNHPESPNVVRSWASSLELLPECSMKHQLCRMVKAFVKDLPKTFEEALGKDFDKDLPEDLHQDLSKTMPNQEQEQLKEKDPPYISPPEEGERSKASGRRRLPRQPETMCPEAYEPTATQQEFAEEHHIPLAREVAKFLARHRAKGSLMVSWEDAFWTWLHNYEQYNQNGIRGSPPRPPPKPPVVDELGADVQPGEF